MIFTWATLAFIVVDEVETARAVLARFEFCTFVVLLLATVAIIA